MNHLKQAALAAQWTGKDYRLRPCCPLCRGLETQGHNPDCVIGLALVSGPDWRSCERICDLPSVDEALRAFAEDQTADNATGIVIAVLELNQRTGTDVPIPLNADMAQLMMNLGLSYLKQHAPERVRTQAGIVTHLLEPQKGLVVDQSGISFPDGSAISSDGTVTGPMAKAIATQILAPKPSGRIRTSDRRPERGLVVKGWDNGSVWAGFCDGSPKAASCDWWFPIP